MAIHTPIFLVGLPRSGSTLWFNVLRKNPEVAGFTEAHFLSVWHRDFRYLLKTEVGDLSENSNVDKLIDILFSRNHVIEPVNTIWFWNQIRQLESTGLRDILRSRLLQSESRDIGTIFRTVIEEATRCSGKQRPLVKFPVYPTYIGTLKRWWPDARIVHISRDPRAIAVSKSGDPGGTAKKTGNKMLAKKLAPLLYRYASVLQYIIVSHVHKKLSGQDNYQLFQYEDLLSQPENTIRRLCEFCQLEFDDAMLNPGEGQASSVTGKKSSGFDPSRAHGWKNVLSDSESAFIEKITSGSMRRFNYHPELQ